MLRSEASHLVLMEKRLRVQSVRLWDVEAEPSKTLSRIGNATAVRGMQTLKNTFTGHNGKVKASHLVLMEKRLRVQVGTKLSVYGMLTLEPSYTISHFHWA